MKTKLATPGARPHHITVVCVYTGNKYDIRYVQTLYNMVQRNLSISFDFICFTDPAPDKLSLVSNDTPVNYRCFGEYCKPGWWEKINIFSQYWPARPGDRVLYLDLDIVITANIDELASLKEDFIICRNFGSNIRQCPHNSSVMLFTPSRLTRQIYDQFAPDVMNHLHSDQDWIAEIMPGEHVHHFPPGMVTSYKLNETLGSIIAFHGQPKPHEVIEMKKHWR